MAYILQSSLMLYFLSAAGKTLKHGSSKVTLKLFAAAPAASLALFCAEAEMTCLSWWLAPETCETGVSAEVGARAVPGVVRCEVVADLNNALAGVRTPKLCICSEVPVGTGVEACDDPRFGLDRVNPLGLFVCDWECECPCPSTPLPIIVVVVIILVKEGGVAWVPLVAIPRLRGTGAVDVAGSDGG
jgi:hypothetical protein